MEIGNPWNPTDSANVLVPTFLVGLDASPGASEPWASDEETRGAFEDDLVLQLGERLPPDDIDASTSDTQVNELTLDVPPTDFAARSASHDSSAAHEGIWEPIDTLTPKSTDPFVSVPEHATADQLARGQTFEIVRPPTSEAGSAENVIRSTAQHQMLTSEAVLPLSESVGEQISVTDPGNASVSIDRPKRGGTPELINQLDSSVSSGTRRPAVQEPPSDAGVASPSAAMVSNSTAPLVSADGATSSPMKDRHAAPAGNGQLIDALTSKPMDVVEFVSAHEPLDQNVAVRSTAAPRFPTLDKTTVENVSPALRQSLRSKVDTFAIHDSYAAPDENSQPVASISPDPAAHMSLDQAAPSRARETARLSRVAITSVAEITSADAPHEVPSGETVRPIPQPNGAVDFTDDNGSARTPNHSSAHFSTNGKLISEQSARISSSHTVSTQEFEPALNPPTPDISSIPARLAAVQADVAPRQTKMVAIQTEVAPSQSEIAANQADIVSNHAQDLAHPTDVGATQSEVAENRPDVVLDRADFAPVHRFGATDVGETTTTLDLANRAQGNRGSSASTAATRPLPRQLADPIISARREVSAGSTRIEITLDPPELGRVFIEITNTQDRLSARLLVAEPTTLQSIRAELPTLLDALAAAGVTIDEFEFGQFHDAQTSSTETDGQEPSDEQAAFSSTPADNNQRTDPIPTATHLGVDIMA